MEEKGKQTAHTASLRDRKFMSLTGVEEVLSFDEKEVRLKTTHGKMILRGKNLRVKKIMETGREAEVEGEIDSLVYSGNYGNKSLLTRLFK